MVAVKFLVGLVALVFLVTFAVKNMEPQVTVDYYFGYSFGPLPFFFALLAAAVLGALITMLYSVVEYVKLTTTIRKQNRHIAGLEQEMMGYKQLPPEPPEESKIQEEPAEPEGPDGGPVGELESQRGNQSEELSTP